MRRPPGPLWPPRGSARRDRLIVAALLSVALLGLPVALGSGAYVFILTRDSCGLPWALVFAAATIFAFLYLWRELTAQLATALLPPGKEGQDQN